MLDNLPNFLVYKIFSYLSYEETLVLKYLKIYNEVLSVNDYIESFKLKKSENIYNNILIKLTFFKFKKYYYKKLNINKIYNKIFTTDINISKCYNNHYKLRYILNYIYCFDIIFNNFDNSININIFLERQKNYIYIFVNYIYKNKCKLDIMNYLFYKCIHYINNLYDESIEYIIEKKYLIDYDYCSDTIIFIKKNISKNNVFILLKLFLPDNSILRRYCVQLDLIIKCNEYNKDVEVIKNGSFQLIKNENDYKIFMESYIKLLYFFINYMDKFINLIDNKIIFNYKKNKYRNYINTINFNTTNNYNVNILKYLICNINNKYINVINSTKIRYIPQFENGLQLYFNDGNNILNYFKDNFYVTNYKNNTINVNRKIFPLFLSTTQFIDGIGIKFNSTTFRINKCFYKYTYQLCILPEEMEKNFLNVDIYKLLKYFIYKHNIFQSHSISKKDYIYIIHKYTKLNNNDDEECLFNKIKNLNIEMFNKNMFIRNYISEYFNTFINYNDYLDEYIKLNYDTLNIHEYFPINNNLYRVKHDNSTIYGNEQFYHTIYNTILFSHFNNIFEFLPFYYIEETSSSLTGDTTKNT